MPFYIAALWVLGAILWAFAGTKMRPGYKYPNDQNSKHEKCEQANEALETQKAVVLTLEEQYKKLAGEETAAIAAVVIATAALAAAVLAAALGSWIPGVNIALMSAATLASFALAAAAGALSKIQENIRAVKARLTVARENLKKQEAEVRRLCG